MIKYKIRDLATGLHSMGGHTPRFTREGKLWGKLSHLKNHLNYFRSIPDTWQIIEIRLTEGNGFSAQNIHTPSKHSYVMLGHGYWEIPSALIKGSPEWSKFVIAKMAGK